MGSPSLSWQFALPARCASRAAWDLRNVPGQVAYCPHLRHLLCLLRRRVQWRDPFERSAHWHRDCGGGRHRPTHLPGAPPCSAAPTTMQQAQVLTPATSRCSLYAPFRPIHHSSKQQGSRRTRRGMEPLRVAEAAREVRVDQTLNPLVSGLKPSKTMALTDLATQMKESGIDVGGVLHLWVRPGTVMGGGRQEGGVHMLVVVRAG